MARKIEEPLRKYQSNSYHQRHFRAGLVDYSRRVSMQCNKYHHHATRMDRGGCFSLLYILLYFFVCLLCLVCIFHSLSALFAALIATLLLYFFVCLLCVYSASSPVFLPPLLLLLPPLCFTVFLPPLRRLLYFFVCLLCVSNLMATRFGHYII